MKSVVTVGSAPLRDGQEMNKKKTEITDTLVWSIVALDLYRLDVLAINFKGHFISIVSVIAFYGIHVKPFWGDPYTDWNISIGSCSWTFGLING